MKLKHLFVKDDESEEEKPEEKIAFPVVESTTRTNINQAPVIPPAGNNPYLNEIIEVYEKGIESINMPGYDFYDFYLAIKAAGSQNDAVYKMAFQMGKTMDSSVTATKLVADAEYYISKINEVYRNYADKGNQKLQSLDNELTKERENLTNEVNGIEREITALRQQIMALEQKLSETRNNLTKVNGKHKPQQDVIKQKLQANDQAMQISIQNLNAIKDGISKYLAK